MGQKRIRIGLAAKLATALVAGTAAFSVIWGYVNARELRSHSEAQVLQTAERITDALQNGQAAQLFGQAGRSGGGASPQRLAELQQITRGSFTTALDHILLVAAVIAFVCGVASFFLIRQKDFVKHSVEDAPALG